MAHGFSGTDEYRRNRTSNPPMDSLPACVRGFAVANIAAPAA